MKTKFKLTLTLEDNTVVEREIESTSLKQAKKNAWGIKKKSGAVKAVVTEIIAEVVKPATEDKPKIKGKRGRKKLREKFTPEEIKEQIKEDLVNLKQATDDKDLNTQKKTRRRLRRRGWLGGLSFDPQNFDKQFDSFISEQMKEVS